LSALLHTIDCVPVGGYYAHLFIRGIYGAIYYPPCAVAIAVSNNGYIF